MNNRSDYILKKWTKKAPAISLEKAVLAGMDYF